MCSWIIPKRVPGGIIVIRVCSWLDGKLLLFLDNIHYSQQLGGLFLPNKIEDEVCIYPFPSKKQFNIIEHLFNHWGRKKKYYAVLFDVAKWY